jgi:hypothetical protein
VLLPDVRGLHRFYVDLAERFAAGRNAIVIVFDQALADRADAWRRVLGFLERVGAPAPV